MNRNVLLFVLFSLFIVLVAGYLAATENPYSDIAISIAGWFIGTIIVLAIKTLLFKRKISEYDVSVITIITILFSLGTVISSLFLQGSAPLIRALTFGAVLLVGTLITLKIFHRANKKAPSGNK
ncbi:hypothetical protein PEC302107_17910 [Pectobacterium araliae]|uniref:Uncharacterized protein n=1 Tax=Pectobacterium araliae TaxID=3073862 RepID=A0AAN0K9E6_9GAMM|nr:hypothetical protein PEC302110_11340 [Pectobacterium sp. MAFF 302110]GKW20062.1 hypothetical protein PEC302107_17910 [Pectobacterium carotovorum subsp. carotovorum]